MICPKCNYVMSGFEADCPRCHGRGVAPPTRPEQLSASGQPVPGTTMRSHPGLTVSIELRDATAQAFRGESSFADWCRSMINSIRTQHEAALLQERGKGHALTPANRARLAEACQFDLNQLKAFCCSMRDEGQIKEGRVIDLPSRTWSRLTKKAEEFFNVGLCATENYRLWIAADELGHTEAKRLLAATKHCATCRAESKRGWVSIATILPIGRGECGYECYCTTITRAPGTERLFQEP